MYDGPHSPNAYKGIQGQLDLFQNAQIIIGPHGAGLTNMLWSADGASVIEFPLKPHVDRNFGFLAHMCNHDYWLLPQIWSNYHLKYKLTSDNVAAAVRLLKHVIGARGLNHLIKHDEL